MIRLANVGIRDFDTKPDRFAHRLNWEFFALINGRLSLVREDTRARRAPRLHKANFWIFPPMMRWVWMGNGEPVNRVALQFSDVPHVLAQEVRKRGFLERKLSKSDLTRVREIGEKLVTVYQKPNQLSPIVSDQAMLELSMIALNDLPLHEISHWFSDSAWDRYENAVSWFKLHMPDRPSIGEVAKALHISPTQLRRDFHEVALAQGGGNKTPKQVFSHLRLLRATELMATSTMKLNQVAESCGFKTAADFVRIFKKHFGCTPHIWRRFPAQPDSNSRKGEHMRTDSPRMVLEPLPAAPAKTSGGAKGPV